MHTILIVDDDRQVLNSFKRVLRGEPYRLITAGGGSEGLEALSAHSVSLVITDQLMPNMSGAEFLSVVKDAYPDIVRMILTGYADIQSVTDAVNQGHIYKFFLKPWNDDVIKMEIREALERYELIQSNRRLSSEVEKQNQELMVANSRLNENINERKKLALLSAEVGAVLIREKTLRGMLQMCAEAVVKHLGAAFARFWVWDEESPYVELLASAGMYTNIEGNHHYIRIGDKKIGRIARDKNPHLTNAVIGDPNISDQSWARRENMVAFAGYPLTVEGRLVGVMGMFSKSRISDQELDSLGAIADGISLGIDRKKTEVKYRFYSRYDQLTLLPNRQHFLNYTAKMFSLAVRYHKKMAILLIDLDNFSRINESLGHATGDECLKQVSGRLMHTIRSSDGMAHLSGDESSLARMGGDEFVILIPEITDAYGINQLIRRLLSVLSEPLVVMGRELVVSGSIGVSVYPVDGDNYEDLLKKAEIALHHAKDGGKNRFAFCSEALNKTALKLIEMEASLRRAIEHNEFSVYFQPKVAAIRKRITGTEALIRWKTAQGVFVPPSDFIPIAENCGLILPIGDWVLRSACRACAEWQKKGLCGVSVAVNVSVQQFVKDGFVDTVADVLAQNSLSPELLELEITETAIMSDPDNVICNLERIKKTGVMVSLDDFGTGYSSLAYIQKLPIDRLKIDISFIRNMVDNPNDAMIVRTICSMAHNLGLTVIAEGVETTAQFDYLKSLNCDTIQGYLFSSPLPLPDFLSFYASFGQ